jgi:hypothetical protein
MNEEFLASDLLRKLKYFLTGGDIVEVNQVSQHLHCSSEEKFGNLVEIKHSLKPETLVTHA